MIVRPLVRHSERKTGFKSKTRQHLFRFRIGEAHNIRSAPFELFTVCAATKGCFVGCLITVPKCETKYLKGSRFLGREPQDVFCFSYVVRVVCLSDDVSRLLHEPLPVLIELSFALSNG